MGVFECEGDWIVIDFVVVCYDLYVVDLVE